MGYLVIQSRVIIWLMQHADRHHIIKVKLILYNTTTQYMPKPSTNLEILIMSVLLLIEQTL